MSISTTTGDDGTSGLLFNRRVPKTDAHIEACGAVDELNAALGLARVAVGAGALNEEILRVQKELVFLMGELALLDEDRARYEQAKGQKLAADATERLTGLVHEGEKGLKLNHWVMPGGSVAGAAFDFARTVCRRAERRVLMLKEQQPTLNPEIVRYLNRLSDLCFVWARRWEATST
ncbi:MAG: cob(I)yrinic acid a,c-diamide adenosyltransferase [Chthoniobacteraceae bacterium]|jgi:cob(I)alamin adenosyltransferase